MDKFAVDAYLTKHKLPNVEALLAREHVPFLKWDAARRQIAAQQLLCRMKGIEVGQIDGLLGPQTRYAFDVFDGTKPDRATIELLNADMALAPLPAKATVWPRQAGVEKFYGAIGKNLTTITPSWPMVVAWDHSQPVKKITLHVKVAASAKRVLDRIADAYTSQQIETMGLHLFGGSFNPRRMRGGKAWSMHSWAIALDFDPERNQLNWGRDRARLAKPDAELFWKLWEEEGWVSLGRVRNYDWMHVQAARL